MVEISVAELARVTGARLLAGPAERVCRGCAIDSRRVGRDGIFVAFPGEHVDGAAFAADAARAGAAAVVLAREPEGALVASVVQEGCAVLHTPDPTQALLALAAWYRDRLPATVVGITGSVGKTTTKDILTCLLSGSRRVHATKGNLNNLIGLPLTVLSAPADTEVLVLEMGMNELHEIERLSLAARPDIAVITKVGTAHIGMLGGRENIARAKAEIVAGMAPGALLLLLGEDDFTPFIRETFAAPRRLSVLLCGTGPADDVRATDVRVGADGCARFGLSFPDEPAGCVHPCRLSVTGAQAVPNALFAAAVAHHLGVDDEDLLAAFGRLSITGRRQDLRRAANGALLIDDSYNASPESMAAGLDLLAQLPCQGARVAVLGEMGELGDEGPRLHGLVGAYAASKKPGLLVCVGAGNAREMARAARLMGMEEARVMVFDSTEALIAGARGLIGPSDVVLVKGSRSVGLDRFVEEVAADAR